MPSAIYHPIFTCVAIFIEKKKESLGQIFKKSDPKKKKKVFEDPVHPCQLSVDYLRVSQLQAESPGLLHRSPDLPVMKRSALSTLFQLIFWHISR